MVNQFTTQRLNICEISSSSIGCELPELQSQTLSILTSEVVKDLPDYFQNINTLSDVTNWLQRMLAESRLFAVRLKESNQLIGFIFCHEDESNDVHIGYLIAQKYWRKGFAKEMLLGLINFATQQKNWRTLIGGVSEDNLASIHLLTSLGFFLTDNMNQTLFYKLKL